MFHPGPAALPDSNHPGPAAPPDKKGPAPNRGAKEDDVPFPKSRGRGGELRGPGPADLFKLSDSSAPANSRHEKGPARRGRA
jgi:hypothetical protein